MSIWPLLEDVSAVSCDLVLEFLLWKKTLLSEEIQTHKDKYGMSSLLSEYKT